MANEEKDLMTESIANMASRFKEMNNVEKSFIAGYMARMQEENSGWEREKHIAATA